MDKTEICFYPHLQTGSVFFLTNGDLNAAFQLPIPAPNWGEVCHRSHDVCSLIPQRCGVHRLQPVHRSSEMWLVHNKITQSI